MTPEKKAALIRSLFDLEDASVEWILELGQMDEPALIAESSRLRKREKARLRAWGRRRCSCGNLNKNCGELMHAITTISPTLPMSLCYPKTTSPSVLHSWVVDKLVED
jgi:hypothetical protein